MLIACNGLICSPYTEFEVSDVLAQGSEWQEDTVFQADLSLWGSLLLLAGPIVLLSKIESFLCTL